MTHEEHQNDDSRDLQERLRWERPTPSRAELDRMQLRVQRAAAGRGRPSGGTFLRSRLALTSILVLGLMMTGTGATLGVTGLSGSGNSSESEYLAPGQTPGGQVLGQNESGGQGNGNDSTGQGGQGGVGGETTSGNGGSNGSGSGSGSGAGSGSRASEQVSQTGNDSLPFTGFAAIPLLVGGVALLGTGTVLRRKTDD
jgi:hypothetical protein